MINRSTTGVASIKNIGFGGSQMLAMPIELGNLPVSAHLLRDKGAPPRKRSQVSFLRSAVDMTHSLRSDL